MVPPVASLMMSQKQTEGWSPSKLASLSFFLKSSAPALQPAPTLQLAEPSAGDNQRPYLGLKYLLRAGPSGSAAPSTWKAMQQAKNASVLPALPAPRATSMATGPKSAAAGRYAPYALQPPKMTAPAAPSG